MTYFEGSTSTIDLTKGNNLSMVFHRGKNVKRKEKMKK